MLRFEPHNIKEDAVTNFLPEGFTLDVSLDLTGVPTTMQPRQMTIDGDLSCGRPSSRLYPRD